MAKLYWRFKTEKGWKYKACSYITLNTLEQGIIARILNPEEE